MLSSKKMMKLAGFMVIATLAAKICGQLRDSFIGSYFGVSSDADAFFAATKIPILFFDVIIGGVISAAFIPVFNEYLTKDDKKRAMQFANRFINVILIITGIVAAVGILFAPQLIEMMTPGLAADTKALAVHMSNIMFPSILFIGMAFVFVGILQSFGEFNIPAIISLVSNGLMIAYLLVFKDKFDVTGVAVAMLIGWAMQAVVQIPSLIKLKYKYKPDFHFNDPGLKRTLILAIPLLISTWVQPIGSMINMNFSSGMAEGAMSSLEYANRLYLIIVNVFSFVVTNLIFPSMSRANAAGNEKERIELMRGGLKSVSFVILPIMAGLILLAEPTVALVYGWGEFGAEAVEFTSTALKFYAVGMIGYSYAEVLNKSFFAMQETKIPMATALISIAANVGLSFVLSGSMGIGGLALASAITATLNAAMNFVVMSKKTGGIMAKKEIINILKIIVSCAFMSAVVWAVYVYAAPHFPGNIMGKVLTFIVPAGAGAIVYLAVCAALKADEVKMIMRFVKPKKEVNNH